jgi:transposase
MSLTKINVIKAIKDVTTLLEKEKGISSVLKAAIQLLITVVTMLAERLSLNSTNSGKPPSTDPNRKKKTRNKNGNKSKGGQQGHKGVTLEPVDNPHHIVSLQLDKSTLPEGQYHEVGFEARQVVEIEISRVITEYRAQILEDAKGKRFMAEFPDGVTRPIQYGQSVKSHSVYLSQYQLIPYERVSDYFNNEASIPISVGSLFNFNQEAFNKLALFEAFVKEKLVASCLIHADETGINVNGKRIWLHCAVNDRWAYFFPHENRGAEAMDAINILPRFNGILAHDHWKPYYTYTTCEHSLCNAHHIRELEWVIDNHPNDTWAQSMQNLLSEINAAVDKTTENCLDEKNASEYRTRYREIIAIGEQEMPLPTPDPNQPKKRGREKKTKARNLLERLRDFEKDTLRFMEVSYVQFTNNKGENAIRMTKVQQKISGCFRSMDGAKIFCRVRSYLITAQKHDINPTDALQMLFQGRLPEAFYAKENKKSQNQDINENRAICI